MVEWLIVKALNSIHSTAKRKKRKKAVCLPLPKCKFFLLAAI
jgi:hypothetical protein